MTRSVGTPRIVFAAFVLFLACGFSLRVWSLHFEDKPERDYNCVFTFQSINLDGIADESAWGQSPVIDSFSDNSLGEKDKGKTAAQCKVLWDDENLYLWANISDEAIQPSPDASKPGLGDALEFFAKPAADKPGYFQWIFTPQGGATGRFLPDGDALVKSPVEAVQIQQRGFGAQCKTVMVPGKGYTLEAAIPWLDLARTGGRPRPGERWNFNIGLVDKSSDGKITNTSLAAIVEKKIPTFFHQTENYQPLRFVGPDIGVQTGLVSGALDTTALNGSPEPPSPYRARRLYQGYVPVFPIMAKPVPTEGTGKPQLLVIHQDAPYGPTFMSVVPDLPDGVEKVEPKRVLVTPGGGTAYDFAFHPNFKDSPFLYIGWNGPLVGGKRKNKASRITRYKVKQLEPFCLDEASALVVIEWESDGHNGAALCFAPDGKLLVTSGDGTADSDNDVMGQRTDTLQAKLLRIDVDKATGGNAYTVPPDNPFFADKRFAPETFAYGLRNPWRVCADKFTGQIWVGNNGQDMYEQAYLIQAGANYGWSVKEGSAPFHANRKAGPTPISPPTLEHHHAQFRSLTGGVVIPPDSNGLAELSGSYVYGDYSTGRIWSMKQGGGKLIWHKELVDTPLQITAFGFNTRGDLILCDHNSKGGIYTLEKRPKEMPSKPFPVDLMGTGLFASVPSHRVARGVVPYQVNAPFWSDGLIKERFIALPAGNDGKAVSKIAMSGKGGWNFPDGTVIIKSFATIPDGTQPKERLWIETRLLVKQQSEWAGYSYRWDDAGNSATLVGPEGADRSITNTGPDGISFRQSWHYPSRAECMVCHTRAANFTLGLCTLQANASGIYPSGKAGQMQVFMGLGILASEGDYAQALNERIVSQGKALNLRDQALSDYGKTMGPQPGQRGPDGAGLLTTRQYPRLVDPRDTTQDLGLRARSWLHSNCSACHQEAGGGNARINLEFSTALDQMNLVDEKPIHSTFELPEARLIAPGAPERSVLLRRISMRGTGQMPPLASHLPDPEGVKLITEWIQAMGKKWD